jgi:hypothetical protein
MADVKISALPAGSAAAGGDVPMVQGAATVKLTLGTIAYQNANNVAITGGSIAGITDLAVADGGTGASNAAGARTNLGLVIGTNVQAFNQQLLDIAALAVTDGNIIVGNGTTWVAESGATARTSLGLGTIAIQDANNVAITGGSIAGITDLAVADGGTGASTAAAAATNLGLGTGDSPQFAAVNIGAATDTTLSRSSAGNLAIEGNLIYRAGGTDVPVADGGTGASDAATARTNLGLGTGDSPQFTAVNIGAATDTTISRDSAGVIAVEGVPIFPAIPQNSKSTAYTTVLADANKHILHPTADNNARTFTIAANAAVAYPIGTAITFVNQINTVTIAINSDTLVLAGAGTTGSRTLAANGMATALKIDSTTWMISGSGLT